MKVKQFIELVSDMRQAQKEYFKTRNIDALKRSKNLEMQVDQIINGSLEPKLI